MRFLRVALLFALPALVHSQVCVPVPVPGTSITQSTLDELRKRGAIAPGVSAFASLEALAVAFGGSLLYVPQSSFVEKFWADFNLDTNYVTFDGSLDTSDSATWSDFSMQVYGRTIANFFQERAKAKDPVFRYIPRFRQFNASQPRDMNMLVGIGKPGPRTVTRNEAPYPLARHMDDPVGDGGKQWSWPRNHLARFHPDNGQVEVCDYQAYTLANPITVTVGVGGSAAGAITIRAGLTPEAFLTSVGSALFGPGTPSERAQKIIGNLEVK